MNIIKLSYEMEKNSPVHVDLEKPKIKQNNFISKVGYNSFIIKAENHSGTHVDAPGHFLENGKFISEYSIEELIFRNPLILDLPKNVDELIELKDVLNCDLSNIDILFFHTGFEKFRIENPDKYLTHNPGISPDVILWIRENFPGIRSIGIDCVSISSYKNPEQGREAHVNAFKESEKLGEPLLLLEDMRLHDFKNTSIKEVIVVPWQIKGIDSAPCTVFAKID